MKTIAGGVATLALALAIAAPAQAQVTGNDVEDILAAAEDLGTAELVDGDNGDPVIRGQSGDVSYLVYFRTCSADAGCEDLNFYAGFSSQPSLDTINSWNRDKRFARAYLDEVGDAAVEMDLDLVQGVSAGYLGAQFAIWEQVLEQFTQHIGYGQ